MTVRPLAVVSGIPPGPSGAGRLIQNLMNEARTSPDATIRFYYPRRAAEDFAALRLNRTRIASFAIAALTRAYNAVFALNLAILRARAVGVDLVVFHPQTIGFARTLDLLANWPGRAFLYGLDNSVFCVRSYNHIEGETGACLRCIDDGPDAARRMGCAPFPLADSAAFDFVEDFAALLRAGRVGVLAQNERNAALYRRLFGPRAQVETVGLWTADWTDLDADPDAIARAGRNSSAAAPYDVVFHGHFVGAKGADWLVEVARRLPRRRFLFPTPRPKRLQDPPPNVHFQPMSWETDLAAAVAAAAVVCVPSLWSATIEGALVKTIARARATARVDTPSAFGDELPAGLALTLDPDPAAAAQALENAIAAAWAPDPVLKRRWIKAFAMRNRNLLKRILDVVRRSVAGAPEDGLPVPRPTSSLQIETLGTAYGGWTTPINGLGPDAVCYCVGVGEDASFDCALIERFGCVVHAFDPTPRAAAHIEALRCDAAAGASTPINNSATDFYTITADALSKLIFAPYGVWSKTEKKRFYSPKDPTHVSHSIVNIQKTENYFEADCKTIKDIMAEFGHDHIDLLKLDVEGAEYEVLRAMLADGVRPSAVLVEFDEGRQNPDLAALGRIRGAIDSLTDAGYAPVARNRWDFVFWKGAS